MLKSTPAWKKYSTAGSDRGHWYLRQMDPPPPYTLDAFSVELTQPLQTVAIWQRRYKHWVQLLFDMEQFPTLDGTAVDYWI